MSDARDDEEKPLVIAPTGGKQITTGDLAGHTFATGFVRDVAILNGKYRVSDGVAHVEDELAPFGHLRTRQKLPNIEPVSVERVPKCDARGKLLKIELVYTYAGHIEIVQESVRPERGDR